MLLHKETYELQQELANYCRDGILRDIEGTNKDRLPNYRRLIYSIINDALETAYPITKQIFLEDEWESLVYQFVKDQDIQTPILWQMPYSFYEYCLENNIGKKLKRSYLNNLLYFEWIEIEVFNMPDREIPPYNADDNLLDKQIIINPEYEIILLEYPVFKMAVTELEKNKGNYFLMVYRDQENLSVHFLELTPSIVWLIEKLHAGDKTGKEIMDEAGSIFNLEAKTITEMSDSLFSDLFERGIILGSKQ